MHLDLCFKTKVLNVTPTDLAKWLAHKGGLYFKGKISLKYISVCLTAYI